MSLSTNRLLDIMQADHSSLNANKFDGLRVALKAGLPLPDGTWQILCREADVPGHVRDVPKLKAYFSERMYRVWPDLMPESLKRLRRENADFKAAKLDSNGMRKATETEIQHVADMIVRYVPKADIRGYVRAKQVPGRAIKQAAQRSKSDMSDMNRFYDTPGLVKTEFHAMLLAKLDYTVNLWDETAKANQDKTPETHLLKAFMKWRMRDPGLAGFNAYEVLYKQLRNGDEFCHGTWVKLNQAAGQNSDYNYRNPFRELACKELGIVNKRAADIEKDKQAATYSKFSGGQTKQTVVRMEGLSDAVLCHAEPPKHVLDKWQDMGLRAIKWIQGSDSTPSTQRNFICQICVGGQLKNSSWNIMMRAINEPAFDQAVVSSPIRVYITHRLAILMSVDIESLQRYSKLVVDLNPRMHKKVLDAIKPSLKQQELDRVQQEIYKVTYPGLTDLPLEKPNLDDAISSFSTGPEDKAKDQLGKTVDVAEAALKAQIERDMDDMLRRCGKIPYTPEGQAKFNEALSNSISKLTMRKVDLKKLEGMNLSVGYTCDTNLELGTIKIREGERVSVTALETTKPKPTTSGDVIMSDTTKGVQKFQRIFGVEVDESTSTRYIMGMLDEAKRDKAVLQDVPGESKYVANKIKAIDDGIAALVKELDRKGRS